jgi:beta-phosphoglucomutase-like phosphatase (HAD superfamily)
VRADESDDIFETFAELELELAMLAAELDVLKAAAEPRELSAPVHAKLELVEHGVERLRALRARFLALAAASESPTTIVPRLPETRSRKP